MLLDGREIHRMPTREVALRLGLLPQAPTAPEGLTVEDLVARARYPHQSWRHQWTHADEAAVERALTLTGTDDIRWRLVDELSGGQRQRAWIAMALAQQTSLLLLDEPTTYLDLAHQVEVLDLVTKLNRERGRTVVMVLHDLNLAARYSDVIVVMKDGVVVTQGSPGDVFTPAMLAETFGLEADVMPDPRTGLPIIVPTSSAHAHQELTDVPHA